MPFSRSDHEGPSPSPSDTFPSYKDTDLKTKRTAGNQRPGGIGCAIDRVAPSVYAHNPRSESTDSISLATNHQCVRARQPRASTDQQRTVTEQRSLHTRRTEQPPPPPLNSNNVFNETFFLLLSHP